MYFRVTGSSVVSPAGAEDEDSGLLAVPLPEEVPVEEHAVAVDAASINAMTDNHFFMGCFISKILPF